MSLSVMFWLYQLINPWLPWFPRHCKHTSNQHLSLQTVLEAVYGLFRTTGRCSHMPSNYNSPRWTSDCHFYNVAC